MLAVCFERHLRLRLDRKHVVFGAIMDGMRTLKDIEDAGSPDGTPTEEVVITNCGVVE